MITTAKQMYQAFLDGIKKDSTSIINPSQFNRIINDWGQDEWIKTNALAVEFNQKQIDDLDKIRCVSDGVFQWNNAGTLVTLNPIAPNAIGKNLFLIPKYIQTGIRTIAEDGTITAQSFPRYLRTLNVSFKLAYGDNQECNLKGKSNWLKAAIMRSDQRVVIMDNPFRVPKDRRLYYELLDGTIRLITADNSTSVGYALRLEFLRYPNSIFFDVQNIAHIDCEFAPQQQKEIVDIAIRTYLERVKDPRYQSFLNEEAIKSSSK